MTHLLGYPELFTYVTAGIFVAFLVIRLGHSVLALMRDLDDYRTNRPARQVRHASLAEPDETPARVTVVRR